MTGTYVYTIDSHYKVSKQLAMNVNACLCTSMQLFAHKYVSVCICAVLNVHIDAPAHACEQLLSFICYMLHF